MQRVAFNNTLEAALCALFIFVLLATVCFGVRAALTAVLSWLLLGVVKVVRQRIWSSDRADCCSPTQLREQLSGTL